MSEATTDEGRPEENPREMTLRVDLYNAAVAYAIYVMGDESNFDRAMSVANRLEEAAEAFADR